VSTAHLAGLLREQASGCLPVSPLTHALLTGAAADLDSGGVCAGLLADELGATAGSVPGLRLAAALHRLVLERAAPRLALHYPSVGGSARPERLWADAAQVLVEHAEQVRTRLAATAVQTNEVGRSAPLWGGLQVAGQRAGVPGVRLLEVGASGGLNLRPDRIGYLVDGEVLGDPGSALRLDTGWTGRPPADLDVPLRVVHRAGCDVHPVDVSTADGRLHLGSFVWPDDTARWERLRAALTLAAAEPVAVQPLSGPDFLLRELARPHPGELTVVWHSVVWQYVSPADRRRGRDVLARAAAAATAEAPLALLVLEPVRTGGGFRFELRLQVWPAAPEVAVLGHGSGHGTPFTWA
jgi:hypothetical protein